MVAVNQPLTREQEVLASAFAKWNKKLSCNKTKPLVKHKEPKGKKTERFTFMISKKLKADIILYYKMKNISERIRYLIVKDLRCLQKA